jgi:ornithine cyclodeaminase/alanine dehydrogenase-like protein (mu-crystallin family)
MPLYLTEEDVEAVFTIGDALEAVEGSFRRQASGEIENRPRDRLRLEEGRLAVMAAADLGLGVAGVKTYAAGAEGAKFVLVLFDAQRHDVLAVVEADRLGRLRTGAASGVAAKYLAKEDAVSLGVIGCGHQAETQIAAIRTALPDVTTTVVFCRDPRRRKAFANAVGAEAAESHQEAASQDVVVTITTAKDPVLRGEWLRPGSLVCAAGANVARSRELDNAVLERAGFVCCDSRENAKLESGDLIEPVAQGVLDWLEVHELCEVVAGDVSGRQSDDDIVVFKSNGIAAWDVAAGAAVLALARERDSGRHL